jgi:hypothetical protein
LHSKLPLPNSFFNYRRFNAELKFSLRLQDPYKVLPYNLSVLDVVMMLHELLCAVDSSNFEDLLSTWMFGDEVGYVVDSAFNSGPAVGWSVVLPQFVKCYLSWAL